MSIKDINIGKNKINENIKPWKVSWYLGVVGTVLSWVYSLKFGCKVDTKEIKNIKGPCLILQNHASFVDFMNTWKGIRPKLTTWVCSVEEFVGREWLMRSVGCFPKRKFTADISVVKNISYTFKTLKENCTIFPEARYSLAGINENIDAGSYARLIKLFKVPVVLALSKGNYISSPQWQKHPEKKIPVSCKFKLLFTEEEISKLSIEEIRNKLENEFVYDDFKYWQESGVKLKNKNLAEGIHRILYKCPECGKEHMTSYGRTIECLECGKKWELTSDGYLKCLDGETKFSHVPDWYRWEREEVKKEVESGTYNFTDEVRIEKIGTTNEGFIKLGKGILTHDANGFTIKAMLDNGEEFNFNRSVESMYSCHIEYNFKERGDAIDLATAECTDTYFVFPLNKYNPLTKIHFGTEELYKNKNK